MKYLSLTVALLACSMALNAKSPTHPKNPPQPVPNVEPVIPVVQCGLQINAFPDAINDNDVVEIEEDDLVEDAEVA